MGNQYSALRDEREEDDYRRLVDAVTTAQLRDELHRDLEAGHEGGIFVPQHERVPALGGFNPVTGVFQSTVGPANVNTGRNPPQVSSNRPAPSRGRSRGRRRVQDELYDSALVRAPQSPMQEISPWQTSPNPRRHSDRSRSANSEDLSSIGSLESSQEAPAVTIGAVFVTASRQPDFVGSTDSDTRGNEGSQDLPDASLEFQPVYFPQERHPVYSSPSPWTIDRADHSRSRERPQYRDFHHSRSTSPCETSREQNRGMSSRSTSPRPMIVRIPSRSRSELGRAYQNEEESMKETPATDNTVGDSEEPPVPSFHSAHSVVRPEMPSSRRDSLGPQRSSSRPASPYTQALPVSPATSIPSIPPIQYAGRAAQTRETDPIIARTDPTRDLAAEIYAAEYMLLEEGRPVRGASRGSSFSHCRTLSPESPRYHIPASTSRSRPASMSTDNPHSISSRRRKASPAYIIVAARSRSPSNRRPSPLRSSFRSTELRLLQEEFEERKVQWRALEERMLAFIRKQEAQQPNRELQELRKDVTSFQSMMDEKDSIERSADTKSAVYSDKAGMAPLKYDGGNVVRPYPNRAVAAGLVSPAERCEDNWKPAWSVFPLKVFRGADHTMLRISADWDDEALLRELRKTYDGLRTVWRKWFSLRNVGSMTMVLADHSFVYPQRLGPATVSPYKNMRLRWFLHHPEHMRGRHEFMQVLTARTDRGIEFVERWQVFRIAIAILLPVLCSLVVGVVYSCLARDPSTAFTIAGYMTSAYSVCLVLVALLNLVEF